MKIALRYMGREHRFREMPDIVSVCQEFKPIIKKFQCAQDIPTPRRQKVHLTTIPFGKRYFEADPCKNTHVCDPLIAKSAQPQELRDFWRTQCCPNCNK